jgi:hypothetical protein
MASFYSDQYQDAHVDVPATKVDVCDDGGRMRAKFASYTLAGAITTSDTLYCFKLPAGARVHNVVANSTDLGTTGTLNIGWAATADEVADADGFFAALDVNAAADSAAAVGVSVPGIFKKFSAEATITVVPAANTTAAGTLQVAVYYTLD